MREKNADKRARLTFAAIADDDTGASDLAGMLAEQAVRTLLALDLPDGELLAEWSRGCGAVVMAEGTRNLPSALAYDKTRQALQLLAAQNPRVVEIKYCSTFDSTPEGNIGPAIDAAMDDLCEEFTLALPALPVNGRTTYLGHHFVHGQLLGDSPMRNHPLTPMTNSNLVEWLQSQTHRHVGLAAFPFLQSGAAALQERFAALRSDGVEIAVVDCLNDEHLATICRASADLRLITGSSAFGMKLPRIWRERGWLQAQNSFAEIPRNGSDTAGCLILAGSCSQATRRQNEWFAARGGQSLRLDPRELILDQTYGQRLAAQTVDKIAAGQTCLLFSSDEPEQLREVQMWGVQRGWSAAELGAAISDAMADLAHEVLQSRLAGGLIVAGGETSGAICRRLQLGALRVGKNITPGVPLCFSLGEFRLPVVLKSGNFGEADFYERALDAIGRKHAYFY
jgi:3-dehydrotetronate 4-kinase